MKGRLFLSVLGSLGLLLFAVGCAPNTEPIERATNTIVDKVVAPAVTKALDETSARNYSVVGGIQGIEPGWEMVFEGYLVQGVKGTLSVRAKGVAGQVQGSTQGDQGPDLKSPAQPAKTEPPVQPEGG